MAGFNNTPSASEFRKHSSYGRTRQPKNLAGPHATTAKTALGNGTDKTVAPSLATHGLPTQNQRFLHLSLKDNTGGLTVTLYAYSHAFGTWGEFIPVGGGTTVATIAANTKTVHKVFDISGVDRIGFKLAGVWDDTNDAFFAACSTF
jgi:hypothetical protein